MYVTHQNDRNKVEYSDEVILTLDSQSLVIALAIFDHLEERTYPTKYLTETSLVDEY